MTTPVAQKEVDVDTMVNLQEQMVTAYDAGNTEKFTALLSEMRKHVVSHARARKPASPGGPSSH